MPAIVAQGGETAHRQSTEGRGSRIVAQDSDGELAVERTHVAGEFGEAEIDQAVQLPQPIAEVLKQSFAQVHEFAQFLGECIGQRGHRGLLGGGETGDGQGIDGIGFGALQIDAREAMRAHGLSKAMRWPAAAKTANRFFQ